MARKKRIEKQAQRVNHTSRSEQRLYGTGGTSNVVQFNKKKYPNILPRNIAQEDYLYSLANPDTNIVFAIGPAGTGKTMLATQMAIKALMNKEVEKIVVTRPAVSVDEEHGFLPGDLNDKMAPWTRPIFDIFEEYYTVEEIGAMMENHVIEVAPLAYMRGRTFKNSWIIADEIQLTTPNQMKMLLTRIGNNCKMIVTGDLEQADRGHDNGLLDFITRFENRKSNRIAVNKFGKGDIERHPVVEEILNIYDDE